MKDLRTLLLRRRRHTAFFIPVLVIAGCSMPPSPLTDRDPSAEYVERYGDRRGAVPQQPRGYRGSAHISQPAWRDDTAPRARFAAQTDGELPNDIREYSIDQTPPMHPDPASRDYNGPLSLGDPGVTASLWRESQGPMNDVFHDYRAWKPMDLVTIVINEKAQGNKQANTRTNKTSTFEAAIESLIGIEATVAGKNTQVNPASLINAETETEFTGQGQTLRQDLLTGTISAMVAEVLPSGVIRVEGEKIILLNGEEQTMRLTGLVRPRDINSNNEVLSNQIANMRIDYYGRGTLGDSQSPGWLVGILHFIWPF